MRQLVKHPCFGERKRAVEQPFLQDSDPLRVKPIEPPHCGDVFLQLRPAHPPLALSRRDSGDCRSIVDYVNYMKSYSTSCVCVTNATRRPSAVVVRVCHTIVRRPRFIGVDSPAIPPPTAAPTTHF